MTVGCSWRPYHMYLVVSCDDEESYHYDECDNLAEFS
jgi:hypothetical protein